MRATVVHNRALFEERTCVLRTIFEETRIGLEPMRTCVNGFAIRSLRHSGTSSRLGSSAARSSRGRTTLPRGRSLRERTTGIHAELLPARRSSEQVVRVELTASALATRRSSTELHLRFFGASDAVRTRENRFGKPAPYHSATLALPLRADGELRTRDLVLTKDALFQAELRRQEETGKRGRAPATPVDLIRIERTTSGLQSQRSPN